MVEVKILENHFAQSLIVPSISGIKRFEPLDSLITITGCCVKILVIRCE